MKRGGRVFIRSLGILFALFGSLILTLNIQVIMQGDRLEGTVIGYEARRQSSRGTSGYTGAPIVEFEYRGKILRLPSQMSSAWHGFDEGDRVSFYFDPGNREEVILESPYHMFGFGGLFLIFGGFLIALPALLARLGEDGDKG